MNHNKRKKKSVSIVNVFQYGIMFLPMLILFLIFSTYPVIEGVFFSFTDWDGLNSKFNFIGLQNYKMCIRDSCIEPWSSLPSRQDIVEDLSTQPGLKSVQSGGVYRNSWSVEIL